MAERSIGLCLSGGGYRAAAYHLGVLRALERLGELGSVRALSTVSGGTLAGAVWAQSLAEGRSFAEFSERLEGFLRETDVVQEALKGLKARAPGRAPSLIVEASAVYRARLFGERTLGSLRGATGAVGEISFNATDLRWGLPFRFQVSAKDGVKSGHKEQPVDAGAVRLADVVAASACFPGAFEPMQFPDDFGGEPGAVGEECPLMDGGIVDNQGIDSMLLIRDRVGVEVDVVLVSDTDQSGREIYAAPAPAPRTWWTFRRLRRAAWALVWALAALVVGLGWLGVEAGQAGAWGSAAVLLVAWALVVVLLGGWVVARRVVRGMVGLAPPQHRAYLGEALADVRVTEAFDLVRTRATSTLDLTRGVFMKRVRDLTRKRLFRGEHTGSGYTVVESRIVQLVDHGRLRRRADVELEIDQAMERVLERAAQAPTTLWVPGGDRGWLDALLVAGQAVTCSSLWAYAKEDAALRGRVEEVWAEVCEAARRLEG